MQTELESERLLLHELSAGDIDFIFELVNSPGWIRFIGDRNVRSIEDAKLFTERVIKNPNVNYWVVRTKDAMIPLGIISFVKRDYLDFHDLGFAFLPHHSKQGYAYEAALAFLSNSIRKSQQPFTLATTIKDNSSSIALLTKLGFQFDKQINVGTEELLLYSISIDKFLLDSLTRSFFSLFTNRNKQIDLEIINELCLPEILIIKKAGLKEEIYSLKTFLEPRKKILTDGTLISFEEKEIQEETKIIGGIAMRSSKYSKSGYLNGTYFKQTGDKFFQFIKTVNGWKISSVLWEDEV